MSDRRPWLIQTALQSSDSKPDGGRWSNITAVVSSLAAVAALWLTAIQLSGLNSGAKLDRAHASVQLFLSSPEFLQSAKTIRELCQKKESPRYYDYTVLGTDAGKEAVAALNNYLNGLEVIATGVNHGYYDESVIHANLATIVYKMVTAHLVGADGRLPTNESWVAARPTPFGSELEFPELRKLYEKWFSNGKFSFKRP